MQDLHPQAHKILAYADNQLVSVEREEVEALLESDKSAAEFLQQLEKSFLPFRESFDSLLNPSLDSMFSNEITRSPSNKAKQSKWIWPVSLAASLFLGFSLGFFAFNNKDENHDNWIVQVADYHLLYVRDTVKNSNLSTAEVESLRSTLGSELETDLIIPDLSSQKLQFKRGQILNTNGKSLVQLAYLPEDGLPVALCILRNNVSDALPKAGKSRGLPYVSWAKNGLSYVIIGNINSQNLNAAALNALSQMVNNS
ncbi:MAG: hypothetical protein V3U71_00105 [Cocleimonas sp.]